MEEPIIMERTYNAPVSKVWKAITDKNQMKQWYFDFEKFEPIVGFEFKFYGGTDEHKYLHLCRITEVIKEKKLSYTWRYDGYTGVSLVTFELFDLGDKTRLKFTHSGLETFPAGNADFKRESFEEGWNELIGKLLRENVEGAVGSKQ